MYIMHNLYKATFVTLLEQDINVDLANDIDKSLAGNPDSDKLDDSTLSDSEFDAMESTLDSDVSPTDYLTDPAADKALQKQIDQRNQEIASVIEDWINKISNFTEFLNGVSEDSLQSILAKAQPGTLFAKVQANTNKKLSNCAAELANLSETLKSFVGQKAISQN